MRYASLKKSMTKKGLKVNLKKRRYFVLVRGLHQRKLPRFHVQFVQKEWEVTSFYILKVTVGCIKNAPECEIALARR